MRIQHNIAAMNSYRNYTGNTKAVSKNLEKLSSGYKINRAGDDAAGLAISEKMRAQITGLKTASKNAKDGISLVQTAEGALTEVHSMLNRMVELTDQSANGTYDNAVDRSNLQKEFTALSHEIDRIADASNFNGIKLLDGSLGASTGVTSVSTIKAGAAASAVTASGGVKSKNTLTVVKSAGTDTQTLALQYLDKDGNAQSATLTFAGTTDAGTTGDSAKAELEKLFGSGYNVSNAAGVLTIEAKANGADKTQLISATQADGTNAAASLTVAHNAAGKDDVYTVAGATLFDDVTKNNALEIDGQKYQIVTRGGAVQGGSKALYIDQAAGALNADSAAQIAKQLQAYGVKAQVAAGATNITISKATAGAKSTGGLVLQIGETADAFNKLTVGISDVHASALGVSGVNIGTQQGASDGLANLKAAINSVSSTRGDLGAIQNRLDHTINNLNVMTENIQEAESSIRDVDVADEMMAYTKNNILVQSAQAMLAQANQLPQGVLQLLQ